VDFINLILLIVLPICQAQFITTTAVSTFTSPDPHNYQGQYVGQNGRISTLNCGWGSSLSKAGRWAECCPTPTGGPTPTPPCDMATFCSKGTYTYRNGQTGTCTNGADCFGRTFLATFPWASEQWTRYMCTGTGSSYDVKTVYWQLDVEKFVTRENTGQNVIVIVTGPQGGGHGGGTTSDSGPSSASASPGPPGPGTKDQDQEDPTDGATTDDNTSGSKAWIAGAVVGPVVAIVCIGLLGFWLGRRQRNGKTRSVDKRHNRAFERQAYPGAPRSPGGASAMQPQGVQLERHWHQSYFGTLASPGVYSNGDTLAYRCEAQAAVPQQADSTPRFELGEGDGDDDGKKGGHWNEKGGL